MYYLKLETLSRLSYCHVLRLFITIITALAGCHCRRVDIWQGVSGHALQCTWDRLTSGAGGRRVCVGKGKGYNHVCVANAMPSQNGVFYYYGLLPETNLDG